MSRFLQSAIVLIAVACPTAALAEDVYFSVPIGDLQLVEGKLPTRKPISTCGHTGKPRPRRPTSCWMDRERRSSPVAGTRSDEESRRLTQHPGSPGAGRQRARLHPGGQGRHRTALRSHSWQQRLGEVPHPRLASQLRRARRTFNGRLAYYDHLAGRDIPGTAWYRHQERETPGGLESPGGRGNRVRALVAAALATFPRPTTFSAAAGR